MKTFIIVVIFVILMVIVAICRSKTKTISLEDRNMDIVRLSIHAYSEGDWSSFSKLHSPAYVHHAPDYDAPICFGAYELSCRVAHRRLPDLQYRILDIFAVKDKVAVRCSWQYRNDSYQFMCHYPCGIAKGSFISISLIKDGKIVEEWLEYDPIGVMHLVHVAKRIEHTK